MSKEASPQNNLELEKEVKEFYQEVLTHLQRGGFQVTPAEAVFLRQTTRSVLNENAIREKDYQKSKKETMDTFSNISGEVIARFFAHFYGIDVFEYYKNIEEKDFQKAKKDLLKYVQEKLRKERELI